MRLINPQHTKRRLVSTFAASAFMLIIILGIAAATSASPLTAPTATTQHKGNVGPSATPVLTNAKKGKSPNGNASTTPRPSPSTPCPNALSDGDFESGTLENYVSTVATCVPGGCGWGVTTTSPRSGVYSAFAPDVSNISDQMLTRADGIPVSYNTSVWFWHSYNLETSSGQYYDGAVMEGSTDAGATWFDLGPYMYNGIYNGTLSDCCSNPLAGHAAWVGNSGGYVLTTLNFVWPRDEVLYFRFRLVTDSSVSADGWHIDGVLYVTWCNATFTTTPLPSNTPTNTNTSTNTPLPTNTWTNTPTDTSTLVATNTGQPTTTPVATETPRFCALEFADVPSGSTFYEVVRCLSCQGVISGYPCGGVGEPCNANNEPYFRPGNHVTRGQLAKIVSQAAGFADPVSGQTFEDVPPGSTSYEYVERLVSHAVMGGYVCGGAGEPCVPPANMPYFRPGNGATRGQLTKIVANAEGLTDPAPSTYTFADVSVGSTFHQFVEALLSNRPGVLGGYACGGPGEPCDEANRPYFRPSNGLTRGQTSKIVSNTFFPDCQAK